MAKLVIQQSDGTTRDVVLDRDRISIGRRPDHDICLPFPAVSADHAEIVTVGADSFLHDLGSTNGTVVNGERVTKHFLRDRDRIEIGRQQLVYLTNEAQVVEQVSDGSSNNKTRIDAGMSNQSEAANQEAGLAVCEPQAEIQSLAPVDELLSDLMHMESDTAVAVEMPPTVSGVGTKRVRAEVDSTAPSHSTSGVFIEVMSGPNAGQITPMTKPEFILGKAGSAVAVITQDVNGYRLIPQAATRLPTVNGQPIEPSGARLDFGDTIRVGGVVLRFSRRRPL